MKRAVLLSLSTLAAVGACAAPRGHAPGARPAPDYLRDIRPILSKNCFKCHGADESHRLAALRLDTREEAVRRRGSKPAPIVPGSPDKSLILHRIADPVEARRMPPPSSNLTLSTGERQLLKDWIRAGAPYAAHWAWLRPSRPTPPPTAEPRWSASPIDRFLLRSLKKAGLKPSARADRYTLIRRISLDLRGIPPSPAEVEAFVHDSSPDAYEKAVDRFLADSAYGERWARMWLDLARYADSAGYGSDPLRTIWKYRDWVIEAFNRNLPDDQFTIEQLAGDLLPGATAEQKIATAFHRNTMTNTEGGTDDEEFRSAAVKDRVDTTMQVWMGLTFGCAKCHNHKYDPISQKEYYSLYAYFNQTADNDQPNEAPLLSVPNAEIQSQIERINAQVAEKKSLLAAAQDAATRKRLTDEIAALEKSRPALPTVPILEELPRDKQRKTRILVKGNFLDPGPEVTPAVPAAFHMFPKDAPENRLGIARWLVSPENPLTARVAVNRFWAQLFGSGLVESEEDFGTQGSLPVHPELLDYLAVQFQEDGWDIKRLLKRMVTSEAYCQTSTTNAAGLARDPRNRLFWRANRPRLEAEMVRDQALSIAGVLSRKIGGPSVFPPQPAGLWQAAFNGQRTWSTSTGEDRYRRGIYTFWRRTVPYPSMTTFDAPSRESCTLRRPRTNTPLQALVTLNDPVYVEAAQALARRVLREGGASSQDRIRFALRLVQGRPAEVRQVAELERLLAEQIAHFQSHAEDARSVATDPLGPLPAGIEPVEAAAWTVIANTLLNLDSVLTRG